MLIALVGGITMKMCPEHIAAEALLYAIADGYFTALCQTESMNIFNACEIFMTFLDAKPCWES